ncbi:MAG: stage III sporulation protein AE [Clostridia bacterium]|nr:stage III sporulation protein AE [Clostridia bacterium]
MKLLIILIALTGIFLPAFASEADGFVSEHIEMAGVYNVYETEEISFGELTKGLTGAGLPSAESVANTFFEKLTGSVRESISLCMGIFLVVLVLSVIINTVGENSGIFHLSFYVCYIVIFMMGAKSFDNACDIAKTSIGELNFFMKAALPVLGTLMTASGGVARTALMSGAVISLSGLVSVVSEILFPVSTLSALISGVGGLSGENSLKGFSSAFKKAALWGLGIIITIFTTVLSIRGFAAVNIDSIAGKTVKYAAGTFVPVVGGLLSETLGSLLACGRLVKGAAGGAAVFVMLWLCISPIVKLVAIIITYKVAALIIAPISDGRISAAISEFTSAIVILLAMVIFSAVMFIISAGIIAAM